MRSSRNAFDICGDVFYQITVPTGSGSYIYDFSDHTAVTEGQTVTFSVQSDDSSLVPLASPYTGVYAF